MRGQADAVASAYSLDDYAIAEDLGGETAYANLRDRAWGHGIRLASDMVPNHMGIDSRWVIEHPEWFLTRRRAALPGLRVHRPRTCRRDPRVGIVLEDHYWDDSDAAVVFQRTDRATGAARYVYHGNDGTSFPWNDTAQLDFLDPAVREQVIQAIIDVARRFPIIRFDAAMVLAKKHIQRLWWPEPGTGGGIPSRAEHALTKAEFDARMPVEFWREVVDRVAAEVPGTLLLAEAFWLLEGYFVRTLGMHRVYNSAFMHMLRDEDTAGYRKVDQGDHRVRPGDPQALRQLHEQPRREDRDRAVRQGRQVLRRRHGAGDPAGPADARPRPGPGLRREVRHGVPPGDARRAARPVAGRASRARDLPAAPQAGLVRRGSRLPAVRLRDDDGHVDERRPRLLQRLGAERSLVLYHNRFGSTTGRIHRSSPYAVKSADRCQAEGPAVAGGGPRAARTIRPPSSRSGTPGRASSTSGRVASSGSAAWRSRSTPTRPTSSGSSARSSTESPVSGRRLAGRLAGRGVASLDEAMRELQLEPIHGPMRAVFADGLTVAVIDGVATPDQLAELERRIAAFLRAIAEATGVTGDAAAIAARIRARTERIFVARRRRRPARIGAPRRAMPGRPRRRTRRVTPTRRPGHRPMRHHRRSGSPWTGATGPCCWPGWPSARPAGWPHATSPRRRAWPGTTSSGCRAPWSPASTTSASTRVPRGRSPTASGSCSHCRARRPSGRRLARPRPACWMPGCRSRRSGWRSVSTPGKASSTSTATRSRTSSAGLSGLTPSTQRRHGRQPPRLPSRPVCPRPPRPPAIGWTGCGSALAAPPRRRSPRPKPTPKPTGRGAPRPPSGA